MTFQTQKAPASSAPPVKQVGIGSGRPVLLDNSEEIRNEIIEYVAEGLSFGEACALAGINKSTMYDYLAKGGIAVRNNDNDSQEAIFFLLIKRAEAFAEMAHIQNIRSAARIPAFWAASAWFLERRYPDRYGKQDRLTVQSTSRIDIQTTNVEGNIIDAESRTIINEFAKLTIPSESESVDAIPGAFSPLPDDGEVSIP